MIKINSQQSHDHKIKSYDTPTHAKTSKQIRYQSASN